FSSTGPDLIEFLVYVKPVVTKSSFSGVVVKALKWSDNREIETRARESVRFDVVNVRIPMMSISRSEVMAISAERSDARLFQCETVIDIRQGVCWFSVLFICLFFRRWRKEPVGAIGVSAGKTAATRNLLSIFFIPASLLLSHRFSLHLKPVRGMHQPVQNTVGHREIG